MKRQYTSAQKAQAIADVAMGQPVATVARKAGLPRSTVVRWTQGVAPVASLVDTKKPDVREEIGELIYEFLVTGLRAAIVQHKTFADPEWVKKQTAEGIYLSYGTMVDKLVLVARGLERGGDEAGHADPPDPLPAPEAADT